MTGGDQNSSPGEEYRGQFREKTPRRGPLFKRCTECVLCSYGQALPRVYEGCVQLRGYRAVLSVLKGEHGLCRLRHVGVNKMGVLQGADGVVRMWILQDADGVTWTVGLQDVHAVAWNPISGLWNCWRGCVL